MQPAHSPSPNHKPPPAPGSIARAGAFPFLKPLLAVIVVALLPYVAWCFFCWPHADDYSLAMDTASPGDMLRVVSDFYFGHAGCWFAVAMRYWHSVAFRTDAATITPLFALALLAASFFAVAGRITRSSKERVPLALGALALYLTGNAGPGESLYWMTGAIAYEIPNALLLLLLALVVDLARGEGARPPRLAGATVLAALIGGSHYNHIVAGGLVVAGSFACAWRRRGRVDAGLAVVLTVLVAAGLATVAAPGNFARAGRQHRGSTAYVAMASVRWHAEYVGRWLMSPGPWALGLVAASMMARRMGVEQGTRRVPRLGAVVFGFAVCLAALLPIFALAPLGGFPTPPDRTVNGLFLMYMLTASGCTVVAVGAGCIPRLQEWLAGDTAPRIAAVMLAGALLLDGNWQRTTAELLTEARPYDAAMRDRHERMADAAASGNLDLVVPEFAVPKTVEVYDLTEDPANEINAKMAAFHGLRTIRTDNAAQTGPKP